MGCDHQVLMRQERAPRDAAALELLLKSSVAGRGAREQRGDPGGSFPASTSPPHLVMPQTSPIFPAHRLQSHSCCLPT